MEEAGKKHGDGEHAPSTHPSAPERNGSHALRLALLLPPSSCPYVSLRESVMLHCGGDGQHRG